MKRKILILIIIAIVCLAGGFFTGQLIQSGGVSYVMALFSGDDDVDENIGRTMTTGAYIVNVRKAPDSQAVVLNTLNQNTEVEFLGEENGWYKIGLDGGETGYVVASFLTFVDDVDPITEEEPETTVTETTETPAADEVEEVEKRVYLTNEFANIRSGPGVENDKVTVLYEGESALYLDTEGDWYQLELDDGTIGYVNTPLAEVR